MKRICVFAIALIVAGTAFFLVNGCGKKEAAVPPGKIVSAEKTSFNEVTSKLDPGGDLYVYLSTEQWLANLSTKIDSWRELAASLPDLQNQQEQVTNGFNVITRVIKDSGIENVSGIGMSSIAREPGIYHSKLIIHHYSGDGNGFGWKIFGQEPHELSALNLLPQNTAMANFCDLDAPQVWAVIQKECEQSGFPQAAEFLKKMPEEFEKSSGMKWNDILESLGGEFGFVVTLDNSKIVRIPLPGQQGPLEIPEPAFMLVAKVKNDAIFDRIDQSLKKTRKPGLISMDKDGLKMRTMPVPVPVPITFRPSIATGAGYLFFATSDAVIQEAVAVKGGKAGLKSTEEFKKLSADMPEKGNQFCFLSESLGQTVVKIQQQALENNGQMAPQVKEMMQSFIRPGHAAFTFAVGANTDEGWMAVANGSQRGGSVLAASAAAPAVLAAMALPAMAKAKDRAQKIACINNLRTIQGAKKHWALENGKPSTATPTLEEIRAFAAPGKIVRCPKGGEYIVGSIDEQPRCSIHGSLE
jgi:hypothetical protein